MANIQSAKKRTRQILARTERNRVRKTRIHTVIRKVEEAVASKDKTKAQEAFRQAEPVIKRGVTKGVIHLRTASRRVSRLSHLVRDMAA